MSRDRTQGGVRRRVVGGRPTHSTFLILCEGSKTEPQYFNAFKLPGVEVRGEGRNTLDLVDNAIRLKNTMEGFDHYWCVFDRDSNPAQNFNAALRKAESAGIEVAYSNEAFEIWYLLHFEYFQSGISRNLYREKLTKRLGRPYEKGDPMIFESLLERQQEAIKNARNLLASYQPSHNPEKDNPCTTVHLLVEQLQAAKR